jgi:hypothetical protein
MSRAATTKNEQAAVDKYLLPREIRVATVRRHPAVLIVPSAQAVGGLLAAAVLSATALRGHALLIDIAWVICGLLLARLSWKAVNWAVDYFVITSTRILLTSGVFTRSVNMMPLSKVTDMSFHRSFAGRLLGYGEFVVESAGQDQALRKIDHIPYPEQLYGTVCEWIFKKALDESGVPAAPPEPEPEAEPEAEPEPEPGPEADPQAAYDDESADVYSFDGSSDHPVEP